MTPELDSRQCDFKKTTRVPRLGNCRDKSAPQLTHAGAWRFRGRANAQEWAWPDRSAIACRCTDTNRAQRPRATAPKCLLYMLEAHGPWHGIKQMDGAPTKAMRNTWIAIKVHAGPQQPMDLLRRGKPPRHRPQVQARSGRTPWAQEPANETARSRWVRAAWPHRIGSVSSTTVVISGATRAWAFDEIRKAWQGMATHMRVPKHSCRERAPNKAPTRKYSALPLSPTCMSSSVMAPSKHGLGGGSRVVSHDGWKPTKRLSVCPSFMQDPMQTCARHLSPTGPLLLRTCSAWF